MTAVRVENQISEATPFNRYGTDWKLYTSPNNSKSKIRQIADLKTQNSPDSEVMVPFLKGLPSAIFC